MHETRPPTPTTLKKRSVVHRLLDRWARKHKGEVEQKDYMIKKALSNSVHLKRRPTKLILLGTESSGKSTIAKQIKLAYLDGFSADERKVQLGLVRAYILGNIKDILQGIQQLNLTISPDIQKLAVYISSLPKTHPWNTELVEMLKALLLDTVISRFLHKCTELQLYDNFTNMLNRLDTVGSPDYIPTNDDIMKIRARTTTVMELSFELNDADFNVVDLGGCRNDQRKWIFFFENVSVVCFVVAVNEYDLQCREDPSMNRLHDSLRVFSLLINNIYFRATPVILLLNKVDLFQEKLQTQPLKTCFPEYNGGADSSTALSFIETKFMSANGTADRKIYPFQTCATSELQHHLSDILNSPFS